MNTIPLTFNEHQINRTILGGKTAVPENAMNVSVILLNRTGSQFKVKIFEELIKCNFASIVSIEPDTGNYNIEEIARRYPAVKFIIPHENVSDGEIINIAMAEITSEYALVLKDDLYIPSGVLLPHLAEKLTAKNSICIAPRLVDMKRNSLPIRKSPSSEKMHFVLDSLTQVQDGISTVFPFDYVGLYNRQKFIELGGFDYSMKSPYWQLLDFGLRAWLWGEKITITTALQLSYNVSEPPIEDATPNLDSLRFYLKNELPKYKLDHAMIRKSAFGRFWRHSGCGLMEAKKQFNDARSWVELNQYKFKMDLQTLIETWV
ncbi:MAG: hypothetical protein MJ181_03215 [Treponema sp.]|nr:hypothetical protein [Treponema sp.]